MKSSLSILNVEDSVVDAELNAEMISARWPNSEFTRVDSRAGLILALDRQEFDVILSDYTMPGFDGMEALAISREKKPHVPFLFVSGTIGEDAAIEALKNGATDYVLKHRLMRLIPAVDRAMREAADRAERERAEMAMRESERKYREVFECLGEAAFLADEKTGKIIDTNRCAEILLGCGRADILGKRQSQFLPGLEPATSANGASLDANMVRTNGDPLPVQVRATKLTIHGHPLVLWLCRELSGPGFRT